MKAQQDIFVSDFLKRENNNLDVWRVIAAIMVIVGHSYILNPAPGKHDLIGLLFGFTYSGALAVKIFFFISGLVVTNSLIQSKSAVHFVISRVFRIFPALIFLILITAYVIGPLITSLNIHDYFHSKLTHDYVKDNIILKSNFSLPGTFQKNAYPNQANAALWSLPYEAGCYMFLLALFLIGTFKNRAVVNIIFLAIIFEIISPVRFLTEFLAWNPEIQLLPACFSIGAIIAYNQDKIKIGYLQTFGFFLVAYTLRFTRFAEMSFYFFSFSLILNLARLPLVLRFKIKSDTSYGIYLWGFLIQQLIECYLKDMNFYMKLSLSIGTAMLIGYTSWILVEKRSIRAGKWLINKINLQLAHE
jgi:peptidoglycan/LPS O-acetylase OafA/YrhL